MASMEDVHEAVTDAIQSLAAEAAKTATSSGSAAQLASAAKDLAEAHAWLIAPSQAH